jgi:FMN-dependent NADH-azoreductase
MRIFDIREMQMPQDIQQTILRVDGSGRTEGSLSRMLCERLVDRLQDLYGPARVIARDLAAEPLPHVDGAWIAANFTDEDARTPTQIETLALSNRLCDELFRSDRLVIGAPVYNFALPAAMKAWIDLVARARKTFRYTEDGPVGLVTGKQAYVVLASGGTEMGSGIDFASGYLRHVLGFLGITDVTFIPADRLMMDGEARIAAAERAIEALSAQPEATE